MFPLLVSALSFLAFTSSSHAQIVIPNQTTGLTPLSGRITEVQQVRVPIDDAVMGSETRITLHFTLQGCLDSLMPLMYQYEPEDNQVKVYVTALNAHNQESIAATCLAMPQATETIAIPGVFQQEQIQVKFLGHSSTTSVNTYTNERFGFRFRYPAELVVETETREILVWTQEAYDNIQAGVYDGGAEYPPNISVSVHDNPQQQSLTDWARGYQPGVRHVQPVVVDGQTGIRYIADGLYASKNVAFFNPDGNIVLLSVGYLDRDRPLLDAFEELVSSFEFLR